MRINDHRSDIKNLRNENANDIDIKSLQFHDFDKINLFIIKIFSELNFRLNVESLLTCKFNTFNLHGLSSILNYANFGNSGEACVFSKFKLAVVN